MILLMNESQELRNITKEDLVETAMKLKAEGWRIVQISAVRLPEGFELTYSFAIEYDLLGIRLVLTNEDEIMSISSIFAPAFLYENELNDLYGIKVNQMSIDFKGRLYRIDVKTPFRTSGEEAKLV